MVIDKFNVLGARGRPAKANPELVIDTDRMLTLAIFRQRLKAVCRRTSQIRQAHREMDRGQLSARNSEQIGRKTFWAFAVKNSFGHLVLEAADHFISVSHSDTNSIIKNLIRVFFGGPFGVDVFMQQKIARLLSAERLAGLER